MSSPEITRKSTSESDWPHVKFGDVVRDVKESEKDPSSAGLTRYIGLEHIESKNFKIREWGDLTRDEVSFTKRFRAGQVLFGKRRAYLRKVAVAEFDGICSSDILTFEPLNGNLIPELLPFIVQSERFFDHALDTSSGSLSPRTRWSQLKDFEFPLPSIDEQRRIAAPLCATDECRICYDTTLEALRKLRASVLIESFVSSGEHPSKREIQKAKMGKGWQLVEAKTLSEAPITKGETPRGKLSPDNGDVPFVKIYNLSFNGKLDFGVKPTFVAREAHEGKLKRSQVVPGDILMNLVGPPLGKIGLVPDVFSEWNINQAIARYRPSDELHRKFLWYYLQSDWAQRWLFRRSKKTSGQRNLTLKLAQDLPVPVSNKANMETIVSQLETIDDSSRKAAAALERVMELQKLLTESFLGTSE